MTKDKTPNADASKITTLILDVGDTLYDVGCGFSDHRNFDGAPRFMVERLGFASVEQAREVRNQYFERFHATAKALKVAEEEGAFPPVDPSLPQKSPRFVQEELDEFFATNLDFSLLGGRKTQLIEDLKACPLNLAVFSNGPRNYVKRVLEELGLMDIFGDDRLFAVGDVLPYCKPEKGAFDKVFAALGVSPCECIMIEDSMKNIRKAKELGLKTILITGKGQSPSKDAKRQTDAPAADDPAVDCALETIEELRSALPGLWETPAVFEPKTIVICD